MISLLLISGARPGPLFSTTFYPLNYIRWGGIDLRVTDHGFEGFITIKYLKCWQAPGQKAHQAASDPKKAASGGLTAGTSALRKLQKNAKNLQMIAIPP